MQAQRPKHVSMIAKCVVLSGALAAVPIAAFALNHDSYNILKNADRNQLCLDIRTEDPELDARAQLWNCDHPVVPEQEFILVDPEFHVDPGYVMLRSAVDPNHSEGGGVGLCLFGGGSPGDTVRRRPCFPYAQAQNWELRATGEIVNQYSKLCLDTRHDGKGEDVMEWPCNGNVAQRWYF